MRRLLSVGAVFAAAFAFSVAFFAAVSVVGTARLIQSDGLVYYTWARTVVVDGDLDFANDQAYVAPERTGRAVNNYPIGMGLVELAPTAVARGAEAVLGLEPSDPRGFSPVYHWAVALTLSGLTLGSLYLVFRRLSHTAGAGPAIVLAAGTVGATNLIEYTTRGVAYTHGVDLALLGLAWLLVDREEMRPRLSSLLGLALGVAVVVRYTNVLLFPWVLGSLVYAIRRAPRASDVVAFAIGAVPPVALQLAANLATKGESLADPYPDERFTGVLAPRFLDVLFSEERGWIFWHPWFGVLLLLFVVSWVSYGRTWRGRCYYALTAVSLLSTVYVSSAWGGWQMGYAFGQRGLLVLTLPLVVTVAGAMPTLAEYAARITGARAAATAAVVATVLLVAWNANLWFGFNVAGLEQHGREPSYSQCAFWAAPP